MLKNLATSLILTEREDEEYDDQFQADGTTPVNDDQWHHFAVVYTGRTRPDGEPELTCYLDGQPERMVRVSSLELYAETEGRVVIDTATANPEAIPVTLFPQGWANSTRIRNFTMALDELFIFEAALSEQQIANLYRHNRYDF